MQKSPKPQFLEKLSRLFVAIVVLFSSSPFIHPINPVKAAIELSITPITWNVIGLDSNNVNVGPNNFPVGARVCNTGTTAITQGLVATLVWDSANTYINTRTGSLNPIEIPDLAAGTPANPSCYDFYFEVTVTRTAAAFDTTRSYHIEVSSAAGTPEFSTISTVTPRELYVEHLISQNRNSTDNVSYALGPNAAPGSLVSVAPGDTLSLMVGNIYTIRLDASTATQGYNQLEDFINFPNTVFQILSVDSTYTANSSGYVANTSDMLYADACLWDMDPSSETYLSCIGSDGKVGGTISTTYDVKIIGGAGTSASLNTLIYDFSGSSFHYNSDFSSSSRYVTVSAGVSLDKSFSPASIVPGGTSTLILNISNLTSTALTGINLTDNLPSSPAQMQVANPANADATDADCLSPTFSPSPSDTSLTFTGGVAANSTCTITVDVTAPTLGTYVNTTDELLINDIGSGVTASANLMVEETPTGSCSTVTIAQWSNFSTYNTSPPAPSVNNTGGNAIAFYSGTQATNDGTWWFMRDASTIDNDTLVSGKNYWRFQVTTTGMSQVQMSFNYAKSANQSAEFIDVYYGNNAIFTPAPTKFTSTPYQLTVNEPSFQTASALDFDGLTNSSGDTYFYVFPYGAQNSGSVWTGINNITFTACLPLYSIQKSFSPDPIPTGDSSVMTIQLNNDDTNVASNVEFTDTLPDGMTITTPGATSTCGGTLTAVDGTSEISLTGGSILASSACTINVNVTTSKAGVFPNTTSYLTVNGTTLSSKGSDTLTVLDPPVISKAFSPNPIYAGDTSTLTFTIQNPNPDYALSGVAFTDTFPANLTLAATPTTPQCGGTVTSTSGSITLSGGTLTGGETCTVTASVTSDVVGEYANTSGAVTATETGDGNTASDTLVVQAVHPGIAILKEVATSTSGPWAQQLSVAPSGDVYYRITVENIGDVPLTSISVSDVSSPVNSSVDTDIAACSWPSVLPVGSSTQDPSATCIVGPYTAVTGSNDNTATAHGTYNGTVYDSDPDTATYATTSLSLDKTVAEPSFNAAGDTLNFTYTITNESAAPLSGVFQLNDTNLSNFTCTLDSTPINIGDNVNLAANNPGNDDTIVCTGVYSVTAFDVSVGSVTNTAYATIGTTRSNSDRVTVYANDPDLIVSKTNNTNNNATVGSAFTWNIRVSNQGPADAIFSSGDTILSDALPSGATYSISAQPSEIANILCAIDGSNVLTCTANGTSVTIPATIGFFTVAIDATPTTTGSLSNSQAIVDPNDVISESNEGNNIAGNAVNSTASVDLSITKDDGVTNVADGGSISYSIVVTNNGPSAADGAVFTDPAVSNLTVSGVTCGSATNGAICPAVGDTTVTRLQGVGIVIPTLPSTGSVTFTVTGTAGSTGTIDNTAYINPPSGTADSDMSNNDDNDIDTIGGSSADLSITKDDSATNVTAGSTINYEIVVTNNGPSAADGAIFTDPSVSNLTVTGVTCDSTTGGANCPDPGDTTVVLLQGTGIIIPTFPSGSTVTFTVTGTAGASGSIVNTATIAVPSGTTDPNTGNNSDTDTDTIDPSADLGITKSDGTTSVLPGATVSYSIVVSNAGPSAADGAIFTDPAVSNLTVNSVTCGTATGGAACPASSTVIAMQGSGIVITTLPSGGSVTFTVEGTAGASGSIVNVANIAPPSGTTDPNASNDSDTDTDTIGTASADLSITKTDGVTSVTAGSTVTYTIVVSNGGPSAADDAVFTDPAVSNLSVTSVTCGSESGGAACPTGPNTTVALMQGSGIVIPTLPNGGSVTFTVQGTAGASGSITNTATIAPPSGTTDPNSANDSATDPDTIDPSADLSITKTDGVANVSTGATVTYTIVVSNAGPSSADGAVFTDASVTNLTVNSVTCGTATGGANCPASSTVVAMQGSGIVIPTLPSGGSVTFTVEGTAASTAGSIVNVAEIATPSGTTDPTPANNSDTDTDTILVPELTLTKSALPTTYDTVGDIITYTFLIENTGDVPLSQPFTVDDDQLGTVTCPATPTTLAPSDTITCTEPGTITQAHIDAGSLTNIASASGYDGATEITSATDTETVNATQTSSIGLAKELTSGPTEVSGNPGVYRFTFTFVVENFGNVSLSGIQVTDDLATAFAGSNGAGEDNSISVVSLTSSDFTVNWPGYDGDTDQNMLDGSDTLAGQDSGSITMIVEFTPVISGVYENTATVTGTPPTGPDETDVSQDGDDPDSDNNDDPTDNNDPTPVTFDANIFDPPSGEKIFNDSGYPVLRWTAVWINADNIVAVHVRSTDEIPVGTTFAGTASLVGTMPGSPALGDTNIGVTCTPASALTTTISCYYEAPTGSYPRGRIIWEGNLGPDYGANNAAEAANEISIVYDLNIDAGTSSVYNVMEIDLDTNNDNDFGDPGESAVASASRVWPDAAAVAGEDELPNSGFAFANQLVMRDPMAAKPYAMSTDMMLTIPSLDVTARVVGIPYRNDEWNVSWLNNDAGWLNGTAYPTWQGNSVITGHVWDAYNQPGIFHDLKQLSYGQKIKIEFYGSTYTYEVRENRLIFPNNVKLALEHEETSWITLLTCEGYQGDEGGYQYRRIVRAVLIKVE